MATEPVIPDDVVLPLIAALPIDSVPAAREALAAVPDGWAKVRGKWWRLYCVSRMSGEYVLDDPDAPEED